MFVSTRKVTVPAKTTTAVTTTTTTNILPNIMVLDPTNVNPTISFSTQKAATVEQQQQ